MREPEAEGHARAPGRAAHPSSHGAREIVHWLLHGQQLLPGLLVLRGSRDGRPDADAELLLHRRHRRGIVEHDVQRAVVDGGLLLRDVDAADACAHASRRRPDSAGGHGDGARIRDDPRGGPRVADLRRPKGGLLVKDVRRLVRRGRIRGLMHAHRAAHVHPHAGGHAAERPQLLLPLRRLMRRQQLLLLLLLLQLQQLLVLLVPVALLLHGDRQSLVEDQRRRARRRRHARVRRGCGCGRRLGGVRQRCGCRRRRASHRRRGGRRRQRACVCRLPGGRCGVAERPRHDRRGVAELRELLG